MSTTPRYRFAPSPTGYFHVGGARTALYNWLLALKHNGTFVLRIEDTDESRNEPQWTQGIIDALAWIGIDSNDPHFEGPYFQSTYAAEHVAAAHKLFEAGNAYYCDQTTEQIQERAKAAGLNGYDGFSRDRKLGPGPGHVLRFRVPAGKTIEGAMHIIDWYPTLIGLAGGSLKQALPIDGKDVWPMITKAGKSPHKAILSVSTRGISQAAIRMGDWKLIVAGGVEAADGTQQKQPKKYEPISLFNLLEDPGESRNLASTYPDKVAELRKELSLLLKDAVAPGGK
jgi:hypothetical protein